MVAILVTRYLSAVLYVCLIVYSKCGEPDDNGHLKLSFDEVDNRSIIQPDNKFFVSKETKFDLTCSSLTEGNVVAWAKRGTESAVFEKTALKSHAQLLFQSVETNDSGRYDCFIPESGSANISINLFVSESNKPMMTFGPFLAGNESNDLLLSCDGENLSWFFNGDRIINPKTEFSDNGNTLKLLTKRMGIYGCKNDRHFLKFFAVEGKPVISETGQQLMKHLMEGERVILRCPIDSFPIATAQWFYKRTSEGSENTENALVTLTTDDRRRLSFQNGYNNSLLTITDLNFEDDGDYVCVATNQFGSASLTIKLSVKDKLAALWPFLGIVTEVAILVSIIFIYEKRRLVKTKKESAVRDQLDNDQQESELTKALTVDERIDLNKRQIKT